jgi:beta-lactamase regulating signal transducer with metallopeptidase domain
VPPPKPAPAASLAGGVAALLGALWLVGTAVWLACAGRRVVRFHRLLRHARPAPEELQGLTRRLAARMGLARCPPVRLLPGPLPLLVWAVGRPCIYFPAGLLERLDEDERASLLTHELAHIRRGDHWVRWLEVLVLALYWWYPLAWWIRKEMQAREEECCDAWVVAESDPRVYAGAILTAVDFLAEVCLPLPAAASGLGGLEILKRRLTLILTGRTPKGLSGLGLAAVLALFAALPLAPAGPAPPDVPPDTTNPDRESIQFDAAPAAVVLPAAGFRPILAGAYAPQTALLALATEANVVRLVDAAAGKVRQDLRGHDGGVTCVAFAPGRLRSTLRGHGDAVHVVVFAAGGRQLLSAGADGTVKRWNASREAAGRVEGRGEPPRLAK